MEYARPAGTVQRHVYRRVPPGDGRRAASPIPRAPRPRGWSARVSTVHTPAYQFLLGRLREARQAAGVTQVELAARLGKRQAYVSRCELGERRLDVIELLEWADALGQPLDYFLPPRAERKGRRRA